MSVWADKIRDLNDAFSGRRLFVHRDILQAWLVRYLSCRCLNLIAHDDVHELGDVMLRKQNVRRGRVEVRQIRTDFLQGG